MHKEPAPCLDVTFSLFDDTLFSACVDGQVRSLDIVSGGSSQIGHHNKPVRCLKHDKETSCLLSGSWDSTVRVWDARSDTLQHTLVAPERVFSLDSAGHTLVVGTANRHIWLYDTRTWTVREKRTSSLKHMTRQVRCMPDGTGFVTSSMDGRVGVDYLNGNKGYAFKCHRASQEDTTLVYPVHALAFHPKFCTFATGGGDGCVSVWDALSKKRLRHFPAFSTSIASLAFNRDASLLAIASSYTFDQGVMEYSLH